MILIYLSLSSPILLLSSNIHLRLNILKWRRVKSVSVFIYELMTTIIVRLMIILMAWLLLNKGAKLIPLLWEIPKHSVSMSTTPMTSIIFLSKRIFPVMFIMALTSSIIILTKYLISGIGLICLKIGGLWLIIFLIFNQNYIASIDPIGNYDCFDVIFIKFH